MSPHRDATDIPAVLADAIGARSREWIGKQSGGKARRDLMDEAIDSASRAGRFELQRQLRELIEHEFRFASPERADRLIEQLGRAFGGGNEQGRLNAVARWRGDLRSRLKEWIQGPIFEQTPFRRILVEAWTGALDLERGHESVPEAREFLGLELATAMEDAFNRAQALWQRSTDMKQRFGRSAATLSRLLDTALQATKEFEAEVDPFIKSSLALLCAESLRGVLEGFGRARFRNDAERLVSPAALFASTPEAHVELLGVLHIVGFAEHGMPAMVVEILRELSAEQSMIDGLWQAVRAEREMLGTVSMPELSRARVIGDRLEFRVVAHVRGRPREEIGVALFLRPVRTPAVLHELLADRDGTDRHELVLCRQQVSASEKSSSTLLTAVPALPDDVEQPNAQRICELIRPAIRTAARGDDIAGREPELTAIELRNFALGFPLDEVARMSQRYLVERPSVQSFVNHLLANPGTYLHCSLRRSGKTTAFHPELLKAMGVADGLVVAETCRGNGYSDRFYTFLRGVYREDKEITGSRLDDWFDSNLGNARVFVLDEYETLFNWLRDIAVERPLSRSDFVNPVLDGFVRASERWSFLFLGLSPVASRIFMEDNQLAPRLQMHPFPLFEHRNGTRTSEFAKLVANVVTRNFEVDTALMDRLAFVTAGHPHFTVSLLRDFLAWALNRSLIADRRLRAEWWDQYERTRLRNGRMQASDHFAYYTNLHDAWRRRESGPWLSGMARLVEFIGSGTVSLADARTHLASVMQCAEDDARVAVQDGVRANFLVADQEEMTVRVRVPIYGMLASGWRHE